MKSIKAKIITAVVLIVGISLTLVGGVSIVLSYNSTNALLKMTMTETAVLASERISKELQIYETIAIETGTIARLANPNTSIEEKQALIDQKCESHGLVRGNILDINGNSIFNGTNYSDRDYFQSSIKGVPFISEPLISKVSGELSIIISAPLWENGIANTNIVGVVYFVPKETFLNDIVATIKISDNSSSYLINAKGTTIAHIDIEKVKAYENIEKLAESDKALSKLASIHVKMRNNEESFDNYKIGGIEKFIAYSPVEFRDGWSLGVTAYTSDFMKSTTDAIFITLALLLITMITAIIITYIIGSNIANPIKLCSLRLTKLAEGDLESPVPLIKSKDETKILADSTSKIVNNVSNIIDDISSALQELANGNLNVGSKNSDLYVGGYQKMFTSIASLLTQLNETISNISQAADEVANGSDQVSSGAQALANGTTEQASAIDILSSTIVELAKQVNQNSVTALEANELSGKAGNSVVVSNERMQQMVEAMNEISSTSNQIGKIIKTIDDIAFQTNILALNAAVEAARAGSAGKGFAVVADEVRNLAGKSAEAAKNTTALIGTTLSAINNGNKIAEETATSLGSVVELASGVVIKITQISDECAHQSEAINNVTIGIEQISAVIQTNSATAEESSAASEELNSQAALMKSLVSHFKLRK